MSFLESIKSALSSIAANKMRSLLTMLGIIIGISAVITITTLGSSLTATIQNAFSTLGANYFDVYLNEEWIYDESTDSYYPAPNSSLEDHLITMDMLDELNERYPDCFYNCSTNGIGGGSLLNTEKDTVNVHIAGVFDGFVPYEDFDILAGRNITLRDNAECKYSALVSNIFVKQYFTRGEEPIGQTISVTLDSGAAAEFTIVGVYDYSELYKRYAMGDQREEDMTTHLLIPYTAANEISHVSERGFSYVEFTCNSKKDASALNEDLRAFFEEQYEKYPSINVEIYSSVEDFDIAITVINIVTIVISIIAAISLLVGGVGVMNIMLVSVTERTREIGIRKALGAKRRNIRLQFVIEAIVICLIGGIIGILIGILNGELVGFIAKQVIASNEDYSMLFSAVKVVPSLTAIIISVLFSTLTGIFFGLYPANKAAKMNPIDALRYD